MIKIPPIRKIRNEWDCAACEQSLGRMKKRFHLHQLLDKEIVDYLRNISKLQQAIDEYKDRVAVDRCKDRIEMGVAGRRIEMV